MRRVRRWAHVLVQLTFNEQLLKRLALAPAADVHPDEVPVRPTSSIPDFGSADADVVCRLAALGHQGRVLERALAHAEASPHERHGNGNPEHIS